MRAATVWLWRRYQQGSFDEVIGTSPRRSPRLLRLKISEAFLVRADEVTVFGTKTELGTVLSDFRFRE